MFGRRFFGGRYFGLRYFGDGGDVEVEIPQPQPQPQSGGGGATSRKRRLSTKAPKSRKSPAIRTRFGSGLFVRVDDEDTRREREEREDQRKRAIAEEVQRSLARLAEIEQERQQREIEAKRAREIHLACALKCAGKVGVKSGTVEFTTNAVVAIAGAGLVEVGSGSVAADVRDAVLTSLYENNAKLASEVALLRKQVQRMKRNEEALEVLMLAA